jgi:hypothetical protein
LEALASEGGWHVVRCIPEEGAAYVAILEPAA